MYAWFHNHILIEFHSSATAGLWWIQWRSWFARMSSFPHRRANGKSSKPFGGNLARLKSMAGLLHASAESSLGSCPQAVITTTQKNGLANERWGGRSWRRFLGDDGGEAAVMSMRRQKSSGQGGGRAWKRGKGRAVRGATGVDNPEWSWNKGCWLSVWIKEWVLNQFLKERKILWCCEWADRIKSLQKENTPQRPCTEYRSKSALPELFIPPLACTQGKFL